MIPTDLKLYTTAEVAEILHLSVYRVRQHIRAGRLKSWVHMGRCNTKRIYITEGDLKQFVYGEFLEPYWQGLRRPKREQIDVQAILQKGMV